MATHNAAHVAARSTQGASRFDRRERDAERRRHAAERAAAVLNTDALMRLPEVLAVVPVSASTWWDGVRSGRFPAGVKIGPRCTAWRAVDIRGLLARLSAEGKQ